jgi:hypothetical protein
MQTKRKIVLHKYLSLNERVEIIVTVKNIEDYEIDSIFFSLETDSLIIKEDITFFTLATRCLHNHYIDEWIADLLPAALAADPFLEHADVAYEEQQQLRRSA